MPVGQCVVVEGIKLGQYMSSARHRYCVPVDLDLGVLAFLADHDVNIEKSTVESFYHRIKLAHKIKTVLLLY